MSVNWELQENLEFWNREKIIDTGTLFRVVSALTLADSIHPIHS